MSLANPEYIKTTDGGRVYILPGVPVDAGEIPVEPKIPLGELLGTLEDKLGDTVKEKRKQRARDILELYKGRTIDAASILLYAAEQGKFNEYARRLEKEHERFSHLPSVMMFARTDVTAFFLRLYLKLGKANLEDIKETLALDEKYGPGLLVYPTAKSPIKKKQGKKH